MQQLAGIIIEAEDLSQKNDYRTKEEDKIPGVYDFDVDWDQLYDDMIKIVPYLRPQLPSKRPTTNKPLTDDNIRALIEYYLDWEEDQLVGTIKVNSLEKKGNTIYSNITKVDPNILFNKNRWAAVDIDDLANRFIDWVNNLPESSPDRNDTTWEQLENDAFYDPFEDD